VTATPEQVAVAGDRLIAAGIHNGRQEARWLAEGDGDFSMMLSRRLGGEPLQHILGTAPFRRLELFVGPGVFIPRPETEGLIDLVLARYKGVGGVLDLCTGSAAIPLALADELDGTPDIVAVEASLDAHAWATRNVERYGGVTLLTGDLFEPVAERRFEIITANPPYIAESEASQLPAEVHDYDPHSALFAAEDGLEVLRRIAESANAHLLPGGWLICEIGETQGRAASALFSDNGLSEVAVHPDFAGKDRFVIGRNG
jgi:release factor glutamine methyltransferase